MLHIDYGEKTETQFFPETLVFDFREYQKRGRNDSGNEYPCYGGERHQVHRFAGCGFKGVTDHVGIDENTQIEHEVIGGGRYEQQACQQWFRQIRQAEDVQ